MPIIPGEKWVWKDEPEAGSIVRTKSGLLFERIDFLWFPFGAGESEYSDGLEWCTLLEIGEELNLWRPAAIGDRVWGSEIKDLPLMTYMVDEDTGKAVVKVDDDTWYGQSNERVVSKSWTALINGGWKIVWMP